MPFVFIVVGIGLVVVAIRGTQATAFQLLQSEFSGPNSFVKWALAIFILGGLGYIPVIRPITRALLLLVVLVIFLKNGTGLFAQFNSQIANPISPPAPSTGTATTPASGTGTGAGLLSALNPMGTANAAPTGVTGTGNAPSAWQNIYDANGVMVGAGESAYMQYLPGS